jgi:hypothetical protein
LASGFNFRTCARTKTCVDRQLLPVSAMSCAKKVARMEQTDGKVHQVARSCEGGAINSRVGMNCEDSTPLHPPSLFIFFFGYDTPSRNNSPSPTKPQPANTTLLPYHDESRLWKIGRSLFWRLRRFFTASSHLSSPWASSRQRLQVTHQARVADFYATTSAAAY